MGSEVSIPAFFKTAIPFFLTYCGGVAPCTWEGDDCSSGVSVSSVAGFDSNPVFDTNWIPAPRSKVRPSSKNVLLPPRSGPVCTTELGIVMPLCMP